MLAALIGEHGPAHKLLPTTTDSAFHALANVIISQQLSIHAAKNISDRVAAAAGVRASMPDLALLCSHTVSAASLDHAASASWHAAACIPCQAVDGGKAVCVPTMCPQEQPAVPRISES